MKKLAAITLTSMMLLLATAMVVGAVENVEVRGAVATADTHMEFSELRRILL